MDTDISIILDMSGSMTSLKEDTIGGFNAWIKEVAKGQKQGDEVRVTVTTFDTLIEQHVVNMPIKEVPKLGTKDNPYQPRGMTALLDAVGVTLTAAKKRVTTKKRGIALIITDGHENSSTEWNHAKLGKLMAAMEKTGRWSFVYLGAGIDSFAQAQTYNSAAVAGQSASFDRMETSSAWMSNARVMRGYTGGMQTNSATLGSETRALMDQDPNVEAAAQKAAQDALDLINKT